MQGKTQEAAAAAAGMSVRSAGKWQRGLLPAERKSPRTWRTRPDPFTGIWNDVIEPLLRRDPESALQATTVHSVPLGLSVSHGALWASQGQSSLEYDGRTSPLDRSYLHHPNSRST